MAIKLYKEVASWFTVSAMIIGSIGLHRAISYDFNKAAKMNAETHIKMERGQDITANEAKTLIGASQQKEKAIGWGSLFVAGVATTGFLALGKKKSPGGP